MLFPWREYGDFADEGALSVVHGNATVDNRHREVPINPEVPDRRVFGITNNEATVSVPLPARLGETPAIGIHRRVPVFAIADRWSAGRINQSMGGGVKQTALYAPADPAQKTPYEAAVVERGVFRASVYFVRRV